MFVVLEWFEMQFILEMYCAAKVLELVREGYSVLVYCSLFR